MEEVSNAELELHHSYFQAIKLQVGRICRLQPNKLQNQPFYDNYFIWTTSCQNNHFFLGDKHDVVKNRRKKERKIDRKKDRQIETTKQSKKRKRTKDGNKQTNRQTNKQTNKQTKERKKEKNRIIGEIKR